jgi:WD40 repeat protein
VEVLRELIDARLLTSYEVQEEDQEPTRRVEIIHESLLVNWPRLVRWQTQDQEGAQLRDELRQAARAWDEHGRHDDRLWSGTAYREFALWRERYPGGLTETEEAFASAMASLATRRRRRRRLAVAAVLLIAVGVGAVTTTLWRRSVAETRRAEAGKLLALGIAEIDRYPTAALAYARASLELADTPEARRFAVKVLWRGPVARILSREQITRQIGASVSDKVFFWRPALTRDGRWLALGSSDGGVLIFPSSGGAPRRLPRPEEGDLRVFGFEPGSDRLVLGAPGGGVRVLSLPDLDEVRRLQIGSGRKWVQLGPGELMTWARMSENESGHAIRIWPLDGGEARAVRGAWAAPWNLDPTLRWITYGRGASVYVDRFEGSTPSSERLIGQAGDRVKRLDFLRENRVLSSDVSGEIRLWSVSDSTSRVLEPASHKVRWIRATDGLAGRLAVWGPNASLDLWDLRDPPDVGPLRLARPVRHQGLSAAFQPGGPWLAVSNELDLAFWPLEGPWMRTLRFHGDTNMALVSFSSDGRWLARTFSDAGLRLWPLDPEGPAARVLLPAERCTMVRFHPDGEHMLVGTFRGGAFLVPIAGGPPRRLETGWEGAVQMTGGMAIDPSGRHAAAVPYDMSPSIRDPERRALRLWELPSGEGRTYSLAHFTDESWWGFTSLEFLPDGSLVAGGPGSGRAVRLVLPSEDGVKVKVETLHSAQDTALDLSADGRRALVWGDGELRLIQPVTGSSRRIDTHGQDLWHIIAIDPTGEVIVTGDTEGVVRVGPATGEEPHLLIGGHSATVWSVDISPDGKWIASVGDEGIRLWPTPDVTKPPLHTLPYDELMAKLDALTNLRVVRDEESSTGWKVEIGPFPGWEIVPEW